MKDDLERKLFLTNPSTVRTYKGRIQNAQKSKKIAFILGAGVSYPFGIPTWEDLLWRLYYRKLVTDEVLDEQVASYSEFNSVARVVTSNAPPNLTILARYLRRLYGSGWIKAIKQEIYYRRHEQAGDGTERLLLYEEDVTAIGYIAEYLSHRAPVPVVTYNFDSVLEEALLSQGSYNFVSFNKPSGRVHPTRSSIFHIHGLLQDQERLSELDQDKKRRMPDDIDRGLVFCEDDYHATAINQVSWQNVFPLSILMNYTCLFVGTSLTDPNQRRLLDIYKKCVEADDPLPEGEKRRSQGFRYHYVFLKSSNSEINANIFTDGDILNVMMKASRNKVKSKYGSVVDVISKGVEESRSKILRELRVYPVYYRDHNDIVDVLKYMLEEQESV